MSWPATTRHWAGWFVALTLILDAVALISIWRGRRHSPRVKVIWTIVTVVLPVLGAIGWLLLGKERKRARTR